MFRLEHAKEELGKAVYYWCGNLMIIEFPHSVSGVTLTISLNYLPPGCWQKSHAWSMSSDLAGPKLLVARYETLAPNRYPQDSDSQHAVRLRRLFHRESTLTYSIFND